MLQSEVQPLDIPENDDCCYAVKVTIYNYTSGPLTDCEWALPFGEPSVARVEFDPESDEDGVECAVALEQSGSDERTEDNQQTERDVQTEVEHQTQGDNQTSDDRDPTGGRVRLKGKLSWAPEGAGLWDRATGSQIRFLSSEILPGRTVECAVWYSREFDPEVNWAGFEFITKEYSKQYYVYSPPATMSDRVAGGVRKVTALALESLLLALVSGWCVLSATKPPTTPENGSTGDTDDDTENS